MQRTIERRSRLSLDEFREKYAEPGKPVIITDTTESWAAAHWTPRHLAKVAGQAKVNCQPTGSCMDNDKVPMSLEDYVNYFAEPDERMLYMVSWAFSKDAPELCKDFEVPIYFRDDWLLAVPQDVRPNLMWLFLGPADSGLYLHSDVANTAAWNVQISGSKAWKLYPPSQARYLYDGDVDAFNPDLERFPRFGRAKPIECVVEKGECIFVPTKWWHQTKNITPGLALTANYADQYCASEVLKWLGTAAGYRNLYRAFKTVVSHQISMLK